MRKWLTHLGRALVMGVAWAICWMPLGAIAARIFIGDIDPPHIAGPVYAGVFCGAIFSALAGVASGRARLEELSAARLMASAILTGFVVGVLPFVIGDDGSYSAGRATIAVSVSAVAAAAAAHLLRWRRFPPATAGAWGGAVSGLIFGALPYSHGGFKADELLIPQRILPLALIGTLIVLSVASALLTRWVVGHVGDGRSPISRTSGIASASNVSKS